MRYICFEGTEGVGKTTQAVKLHSYLVGKGYKVLLTKEPGTAHSPLTMKLREIMLSKEFDKDLTIEAREMISQAIRSIHLQKVIEPAIENDVDFIIQDRGVLSGIAYGKACGFPEESLAMLTMIAIPEHLLDRSESLYDNIIYLKGDVTKNLEVAKNSKQEFAAGDAIEAKGNEFMQKVAENFDEFLDEFEATVIDVDGKDVNTVFEEIRSTLSV